MMKFSMILTPTLVLAVSGSTKAANFAALSQPPTLINLAIFGVACACFVFCVQVASLVRGGHLSRTWQLFMAGFGVLALVQIFRLMVDFEILLIPSWVIPTVMIAMSGLFLYGLIQTKRTLE